MEQKKRGISGKALHANYVQMNMIVSLYTSNSRSPFWLKLLPIKIQVMSQRKGEISVRCGLHLLVIRTSYRSFQAPSGCPDQMSLLSCDLSFVCDESEFLNKVPVGLQHFCFKNATKKRSGTPSMKRSSAYPALFGRAFRIAHELGIKYGDTRVHGKEILDEIDMRVRNSCTTSTRG